MPFDRDAVAVPNGGVVIPDRVMLHASVVPEGDRIGLPSDTTLKPGRLNVAKAEPEALGGALVSFPEGIGGSIEIPSDAPTHAVGNTDRHE